MQTVNMGTSEQILLKDVTHISLLSNCNNCNFQAALQVPTEEGSHVGRPTFVFPCEQLECHMTFRQQIFRRPLVYLGALYTGVYVSMGYL